MNIADLSRINRMARQQGRRYRVLIVDDEERVREVFRDFCELTDAFEVTLADSGQEAVKMVRTSRYDVITLDLVMPEMSGLDVLLMVKEISPRVPVVIITGNATDRLVNEAGVLGACRVMYKPVVLRDFIEGLASTLER